MINWKLTLLRVLGYQRRPGHSVVILLVHGLIYADYNYISQIRFLFLFLLIIFTRGRYLFYYDLFLVLLALFPLTFMSVIA